MGLGFLVVFCSPSSKVFIMMSFPSMLVNSWQIFPGSLLLWGLLFLGLGFAILVKVGSVLGNLLGVSSNSSISFGFLFLLGLGYLFLPQAVAAQHTAGAVAHIAVSAPHMVWVALHRALAAHHLAMAWHHIGWVAHHLVGAAHRTTGAAHQMY